MPGSYKQLDFAERRQVYFLRKQGLSCRGIARQLGRSPSTISREFRRNSGGRGYRFSQAQRMAWERRSETSSVPRKMTGRMWAIVEGKLAMQWSPEQISGRLRLDEVVSVSAEWIYRHVWEDKRNGGDLYKHLRRRGKKRNARGSKYSGRGHIPGRVDISERPGAAQEKGRVGDWEADTIVGAGHKGALVSIVNRSSKFAILQLVGGKEFGGSGGVVVKRLLPHMEVVHTITSDNGKELAGHGKIAQELGTGFFFATPYHSWERGLNEHTNGLVRQYFPKATDFHEVLGEDVRRVEELLNGRPRKVLNYRTPAEVFNEASC